MFGGYTGKNLPDENNVFQIDENDENDNNEKNNKLDKDFDKDINSIFDLFKGFLESPVNIYPKMEVYRHTSTKQPKEKKEAFRKLHTSILKSEDGRSYTLYIYLGVPSKYISCNISSRKFVLRNTQYSEERFYLVHNAYPSYIYEAHEYSNGVLSVHYKYVL